MDGVAIPAARRGNVVEVFVPYVTSELVSTAKPKQEKPVGASTQKSAAATLDDNVCKDAENLEAFAKFHEDSVTKTISAIFYRVDAKDTLKAKEETIFRVRLDQFLFDKRGGGSDYPIYPVQMCINLQAQDSATAVISRAGNALAPVGGGDGRAAECAEAHSEPNRCAVTFKTIGCLLATCLATLLVLSNAAKSAVLPSDSCSVYGNGIEGGYASGVPVVPDRLLASDWKEALSCLVPIIGALKVTGPKFNPETQSKFLSATGALRAIITRLSLSDEKLKTAPAEQRRNQDTLNDFIKAFRDLENLDVMSVLTFGVRSDNYDMRLNSVLILGNVVDDRTVCIPLTHLNDPELDKTDYGINGRANLLGIIAVVAPWALKQNFESIKATRDSIFQSIRKDDPNLKQTYALLDNIDARLKVQTPQTNKSVDMPANQREDCKRYIEEYRPKLRDTRNLAY
jgi:hypothetical protein